MRSSFFGYEERACMYDLSSDDPTYGEMNVPEDLSSVDLSASQVVAYPRHSGRITNDFRFVYVLDSVKTNLVKIGISRNIPARINQMKTGDPTLRVVFALAPLYVTAYEVEQYVHRMLWTHRISAHEWFYVSEEKAAACIMAACRRLTVARLGEPPFSLGVFPNLDLPLLRNSFIREKVAGEFPWAAYSKGVYDSEYDRWGAWMDRRARFMWLRDQDNSWLGA